MFGHGRPPASPPPPKRNAPRASIVLCAVLAAFFAPTASAVDTRDTLRVRVAWGGGPAVQWQGTIELSDGTLSEIFPLGVNPDEAGSLRNDNGRLRIRQRNAKTYDGVDFLASASPETSLTIRLSPVRERARPAAPTAAETPAAFVETIPLAKLVDGVVDLPLGDDGNRILVMRSPGDALRVDLGAKRDSLVFAPGETLDITLQPHRLPIAPGTKLRIVAQLNSARGGAELWSQEERREVAPGGSADAWSLSIPVPDRAGVYDVRFSAYPWGLRERLDPAKRLGLGTPLAARTVQFVVYDARAADPAAVETPSSPFEVVVELDPANPSWWTRFIAMPQLRKWSLLPKSSWDHGEVARAEHPELRATMQLGPGSWEALPLPVEQLGIPHVVEIDYPSDVAQSLGVSILDPNAAGELVPVGLDSGVYVETPTASPEPARWLTHRLAFWPRTKTPLVLLVNRDDAKPAVHGKIRVLAGPENLPNARRPGDLRPERLFAGYLERPLLARNFSASEVYDAYSRRSLEDWVTFYEASTRLAEYLDYVGYGGVIAAVASEGSTIYPSRVLEPTPRNDTGVFLSTGSDPLRKDALELLFRVFDRRSLTLIPAVQFSSPLPALETLLAERPEEAVGIVPIGRDGLPASTADAPNAGGAPFYNPLDSRVQQAMLDVVAELVDRYGRHPSLGGIAIQLSTDGYGVLPGIEWSLDDATWSAYERATGQTLAAKGPDRFARRADAVTGPHRAAWLRWRADRLAEFQRRAAAIVAGAGQDVRLYVSAAAVWDSPAIRERLRPSLTRPARVDDALLAVGIDIHDYAKPDMANVVFLRPNRIGPPTSLDDRAADVALNQAAELDRALSAAGRMASVFYHPPSRLRLKSFDEKSPVGPQKTFAWLAAQMSPSGVENRRRFVHALAVGDAPAMFDGGFMLPLGQEETLRDLIDVYRRLPAGRFETLESSPRPVTIRVRSESRRTLAYVTNDAPWRVALDVAVAASPRCRALSLSPQRPLPELTTEAGSLRWRVALEPYDVVGVVFTEPGVALADPSVETETQAVESLRRRVAELGERQQRLAKSPSYDVLANAGFELPAADGKVPHWTTGDQPGVAVTLGGAAVEGQQAATIVSSGRVAWLTTEWFDAPKSGRLAVLVALKTADATRQPPLRVAIDSTAGRVRYRFIEVGAAPANVPLTADWAEYLFPFESLPTSPGTKLRVRFDLMGAGEARVDDVRLLHLSLSPEEKTGLAKIVSLANLYVRDEQWADCAAVLDGYWPRFVEENVPLEPLLQARRDGPTPRDAPAETPADEDSGRVLDKVKKYTPFLK
ncbi:MAG: hypothetical protein DCC68_04330 [Planctomycetota bacterium]|nr:MAG: hypothetical protein DCC68_04330 [Planctomycetota bacterium]